MQGGHRYKVDFMIESKRREIVFLECKCYASRFDPIKHIDTTEQGQFLRDRKRGYLLYTNPETKVTCLYNNKKTLLFKEQGLNGTKIHSLLREHLV